MAAPLCAPLLLAAAASAPAPGVADLLRDVRDELADEREEPAGARIARLGPDVVAPILAVLEDSRWPADEELPAARLSEPEAAALIGALGELYDPWVRSHLERLTRDGSAGERVAALRVLAEIGEARDLVLVFRLGASPADRLRRAFDHAVPLALAGILERGPGAFDELSAAWSELDAEGRQPVLLALRSVRTGPAVEFLLECLDEPEPELDLLLALERLAADLPAVPAGLWLSGLRRQLGSRDADLRAAAAACLGHLEDLEAVPDLLDLLEDDAAKVRRCAVASLRRLSGCGFAEAPERWRAWYDAELAWWRSEAADVVDRLESGDPARSVPAALALRGHRLFLEDFLSELTGLLFGDEPAGRAAACHALAGMRRDTAVAVLVEALDGADADLEEAVRRALEAITGSADPGVWTRASG